MAPTARWARHLLHLMVVGMVTACSHWEVQHVAPLLGLAAEGPATVRLALTDNTRMVIHEAAARDSFVEGAGPAGTVAVAASQIDEWAIRRGGPSGPVKAAVTVAGVALVVYAVIAAPTFPSYWH